LEKDRNLRYQGAAELRADLQRLKRDIDSGRSASVGATEDQGQAGAIATPTSRKEQAASASRRIVAEKRRNIHRMIWGLAAAVLIAVIAGGLYWRSHQSQKLTDKGAIVLADFVNTTGDPVFDDTLKQALTAALQQSPLECAVG
jgi:hypothetical protein